jgi:hypothetical protein
MRTILTAAAVALAVFAPAPGASAFGMRGGAPMHLGAGGHGGPGRPPGMPLRLLISQMTPAQRREARQILIADRGERRETAEALRAAHEALADKMFAPGPLTEADIAPEVAKIAALHQQLLDHGTRVMLKVRAIATPEQLATAARTKEKLAALRKELDALMGPPSPDDVDSPE